MSYFISLAIYVSAISTSTLFVFLSEYKKQFNKTSGLIAILIPSLLAAFRQSGIDYKSYLSIYNHFSRGFVYDIEIGWRWLNQISSSYEMLLFISALVFFGISFVAICKFVDKRRWVAWLSFIILCMPTFFNVMRQMVAVAVVFLGFAFLYNKKNISFIICVFLGFLFHKSAIFILLIVPIYKFICKYIKTIEWFIVALSGIMVISVPLLEIIVAKLGMFEGYFTKDVSSISFGFLLYTLPPLFFYYNKKSRLSSDSMLYFCIIIYLLVIPFQIIGNIVIYADRLMLYFQPMICVAIPMIIRGYDVMYKKHEVTKWYIIWFVIQYIILHLIMNSNGIYPYRMDF